MPESVAPGLEVLLLNEGYHGGAGGAADGDKDRHLAGGNSVGGNAHVELPQAGEAGRQPAEQHSGWLLRNEYSRRGCGQGQRWWPGRRRAVARRRLNRPGSGASLARL